MRGGGCCLKTGEGLDERQSKKRGCKHCSDLINVKLTPESILLPTSREEQPRHGRTGDLTDQYGLPKADETNYDWYPISSTWREMVGDFLKRSLTRLVRPDRRLGRPRLARLDLFWPFSLLHLCGVSWHRRNVNVKT